MMPRPAARGSFQPMPTGQIGPNDWVVSRPTRYRSASGRPEGELSRARGGDGASLCESSHDWSIKGPNLIREYQFDGHRVLGTAEWFADHYYRAGADELIYQDAVASLYRRNSLLDIVQATASRVFVPLTVAGGNRSVDDVRALLRAGADKVAINTAAIENPILLRRSHWRSVPNASSVPSMPFGKRMVGMRPGSTTGANPPVSTCSTGRSESSTSGSARSY